MLSKNKTKKLAYRIGEVEILSTAAQLYLRKVLFENACNRWMTLKVTQGHRNCCYSIGHQKKRLVSYKWPQKPILSIGIEPVVKTFYVWVYWQNSHARPRYWLFVTAYAGSSSADISYVVLLMRQLCTNPSFNMPRVGRRLLPVKGRMNSTGMVCIATLNKIYVLPSPQCYWYVQNLRCYASVAGQTGLLPVRILCWSSSHPSPSNLLTIPPAVPLLFFHVHCTAARTLRIFLIIFSTDSHRYWVSVSVLNY